MQHDGAETAGLLLYVLYCIKRISAFESRLNVTYRLIRPVEWNCMKPGLWGLSVTALVAWKGPVLLQVKLAKCGPEMIRTHTTEIMSRTAKFWGVTLHHWMSRC